MGLINVKFSGICTHVRNALLTDTVQLPGMPPHRVILVHAECGAYFESHQTGVPPHIPMLEIDPRSIEGTTGGLEGLELKVPGVWQMRGVSLRIANPIPTNAVTYAPDWEQVMPSLTFYAGFANPALALDAETVTGQNAAGYFDVDHGRFTASYVDDGDYAAKATLSVETDGLPQIVVTRFYDRKVSRITLADAQTILVENIGETKDTDWDFLLHYFVAQAVPSTATHPPTRSGDPSGLGAGCSNSNYP